MTTDNDSRRLTLVERIQQDFPNTPTLVVPMHCADNKPQHEPHQYHYADITVLFDATTTTTAETRQSEFAVLGDLRDDELAATVARLGTRQHGSRLLQRLLQTLPYADEQRLLAALVRVLPALWTDPFGNYLAQALFDVAHPPAAPTLAAQRLAGHVAVLACDPYGCRVVQKALQRADTPTAAALAGELRGRVCACAQDACGNHVLQRVAECVPLCCVPFVPAELCGHAAVLACDRCACRVLQRLLEHNTGAEAAAAVFAPVLHELCAALPRLLTDPFGGYVAQCVAVHGGAAQHRAVLAALRGRVVELVRHPLACGTIEACLVHACADNVAACVLPELAGPRGDGAPLLAVLGTRPGAAVVARCLACFPPPDRARLAALVRHHAPRLQHRPHCRRVLALSASLAPSSSVHIYNLTGKAQELAATCAECTGAGNVWIVGPLCEERCVAPPSGTLRNVSVWRSSATSTDECSAIRKCTFVDGMRDGSFEENLWEVKTSGAAQKPLCTREDEADVESANDAAAADGTHYLWFGGYDFFFTQSATLTQQKIPRGATHIAMFVSEMPPAGEWRSSLFLRIDGTQVLHIDQATRNDFTKVYRNVDVDIRKYADDKEHTIQLFFNADEVSGSFSIFVDYLRFIRDDTMQGNTPDIAWPTYTYCDDGCNVELTRDSTCDRMCNTIACGFDNGACEADPGSNAFCHSRINSGANPGMEVCSWYSKKTCCTRKQDTDYMGALIKAFQPSTKCQVQRECQENIDHALCAPCSPNSNVFIRNTTLMICDSFINLLFESCKDSFFEKDGECQRPSELYTSAEEFAKLFGVRASDNTKCFSDTDYDSIKPSEPAWKSAVLYAVIGIACALIIVAIIVLVVVLVRNKRAREAAAAGGGQVVVVDPNMLATQPLDGTGEVYLVPLDQVVPVAAVPAAGGNVEYIVQPQ